MNKKEVIEMVSKLLKFAKEGEEVVPNPEPAKESEMEKVKMAAEAKTKDGLMLMTPAEKWEKDVEVFIVDENGENKPAEDNTYELEDGTKLVVEGGKVKEIVAIEAPKEGEAKPEDMATEKFSAYKTDDDTEVFIEGEIKVGNYVYYNKPSVQMIDGKQVEIRNTVWNNEVKLETGEKLGIIDGKIVTIEPSEVEIKDVEVASEEMSKLKEKMSKMEERFSKVLEATTHLTEAFSKLPVSDKINLSASSTSEEFGRKPISKKEKNLKEIYSVLEEIRDEQNNKNKK